MKAKQKEEERSSHHRKFYFEKTLKIKEKIERKGKLLEEEVAKRKIDYIDCKRKHEQEYTNKQKGKATTSRSNIVKDEESDDYPMVLKVLAIHHLIIG